MYKFFNNQKRRLRYWLDAKSCIVLSVKQQGDDVMDAFMHFNENGVCDFIFHDLDYEKVEGSVEYEKVFLLSPKTEGHTLMQYEKEGYSFYHPSEAEKVKVENIIYNIKLAAYKSEHIEEDENMLLYNFKTEYNYPNESCITTNKKLSASYLPVSIVSIINKETGVKSIVRLTNNGWFKSGLFMYDYKQDSIDKFRIWYEDEINLNEYDIYRPTSDEWTLFFICENEHASSVPIAHKEQALRLLGMYN